MWGRGGAYNGEILRVTKVKADLMRDAGRWTAVQIENRAQSGRDEAGSRFKPYSARYAQQKNVNPSQVTLTRSGEMFQALDVLDASENRVTVGFTNKDMERRARYNEENGRRFMGIDPRWLREIKNRIVKGIGFVR